MSKKKDKKELTLYVCGVDWQHEIGEAWDGNHIYYSLSGIKKFRKCTKDCGIVKLKATLEVVSWPIKQKI